MPRHPVQRDAAAAKQMQSIEAMLREVPLDAGGDLDVQRPLFDEFMRQQPLPDDIPLTDGTLGGVSILEIAAPEAEADATVLYFHGECSRWARREAARGSPAS